MEINWTFDNCFRHPFRWGKCPAYVEVGMRVWGIRIRTGELLPTKIKPRWTVAIYFGERFKAWSNHPLTTHN